MRFTLALCATAALSMGGCFMDHGIAESVHAPPEVEAPPPPLVVEASISSATLGDDCPEADRGAGGIAGDCDGDGCGFCQQSNVQLAITTSAGDVAPLTFEVLRVTLHDHATGEELQQLTWRNPRTWDDELGYVEWDELLPAPSDLATRYDLSAPDWAAMSARGGSLFSQPFQLRMLVEIEGAPRTLVSDEVYRVSDIDT